MSREPDSSELQAFSSSLKREFEAFRSFHEILGAEHTALLSGDADQLLALAERKNALVQELGNLAAERNRYLAQQEAGASQEGMSDFIARLDPTSQQRISSLWQTLIELARKAKELNQGNGQLIQANLAHNQQALNILLGVNRNSSNLYGADGQAYSTKPGGGSGRTLGKA